MKRPAIILLIAFLLPLMGCAGSGKPGLKDGMFLIYDNKIITPGGPASYNMEYKFTRENDGKFKVKVTPSQITMNSRKLPLLKPFEAKVNDEMKTDRGDLLLVLSVDCPLWLPPDKRNKGSDNNGFKLTEIKKWEKWECCISETKNPMGEMKVMHDKNTGFFVGAEVRPVNGKVAIKLTETNVDGL